MNKLNAYASLFLVVAWTLILVLYLFSDEPVSKLNYLMAVICLIASNLAVTLTEFEKKKGGNK